MNQTYFLLYKRFHYSHRLTLLCTFFVQEMGDSERGNVALYTANEMINIIQTGQKDAYER